MPESDVVVIGAGAGGLAAAWRLVSNGARVTVLEAGKRYLPLRDYPQTEDDFELHPFPYDAARDEEGNPRYSFGSAQEIGKEWKSYRSWNRGQGRFVTGDRRSYQQYAHVQGVGGSTLHYQGEAHRFHPRSLRMRSLFGVACDWPLAYDELARYYDLAEECMGVAAPKDNPFRPRTLPPVLPEHPLSWASRKLLPAFAAVGATLIPNSLAILSRPYRGRPQCNLCDSCTNGCPLGDKGSSDVTFLPPALATGRLDLKAESHALALETGPAGRITGVVYRGPDGVEKRARAKWFVMAGGAVETPRLLLASRSARFPDGVGNGSGQVGRNFTETLVWTSVALLPERVDSYRGLPVDGVAWDFAVPSASNAGWVGGFRIYTAHGEADLRGPVAYATRLVEGFGTAHERRLREVFGRAVAVAAMGDWLPNERTRIELDPFHHDRFGIPLARIVSILGSNERQLLRSMADRVRAVIDAAHGELAEETSSLDLFNASHVLGTCRMGSDPKDSVADADGICHEVPNLAFADGSLVPSSGSGDAPTLTITALALRTADRILARSA